MPTAMESTTRRVRGLVGPQVAADLAPAREQAPRWLRVLGDHRPERVQALLADLAVGDVEAAAYARGDVVVVGDHDDGLAGPPVLEEPEHGVGGLRVEVAGGLVGGDDRRVVGERTGNGDALLLAAGERRGQLVGLVGHLDLLEQVQGPLGSLAGV